MIMANDASIQEHVKKFIQVTELYDQFPNTYKCAESKENIGMAVTIFDDSSCKK